MSPRVSEGQGCRRGREVDAAVEASDASGGVCHAVGHEVQHRSAADHRPAAADDDGGVFEQPLEQLRPHVLLRLVVQR